MPGERMVGMGSGVGVGCVGRHALGYHLVLAPHTVPSPGSLVEIQLELIHAPSGLVALSSPQSAAWESLAL